MNISLPEALLYDVLEKESRPLYLYGTGDGADKLLKILEDRGLHAAGIFVSEEFFRGQTFHEFTCTTLSHLDETLGPDGFVILVAFGSHFPDMIHRIKTIAENHTLYVPDMPVAGDNVFDKDFFFAHQEELSSALDLFEDPLSRKVFLDAVEYKLTGQMDPLFRNVTSKEEVFSELIPLKPSIETFLDLGAYNGDTVEEFCSLVGTETGCYRHIYAMEPDPRTFKKLVKKTEGLSDITCINAAAGDTTHEEILVASRGRGNKRSATATPLPGNQAAGKTVTILFQRIDDLGITPSYVKIDVEGAEAEAIRGMESTLVQNQPKLNIALYHRSEDLFALPLELHALLPDHQFFLRRHDCFPCWELNLYARPRI